jgi:hypothetical protein
MSDLAINVAEIGQEVHPVIASAAALAVIDEATYVQAMEIGKACAERIKMVEDRLGPAKHKTYEAYQEVLKLMKSFVDPLTAAKKMIADRAYDWKKFEENRRRRESEEARRKAEEEAAKQRRAEEDARLAAAEELERQGHIEEADKVLAAPIIETPIVGMMAPEPIKVAGTSTRENWQFEIVNEALLPREYLMPDLVKIGRAVKAGKGGFFIPGVHTFDAGTVSFR